MGHTEKHALRAFVEELRDFLRAAGELDLADLLSHANRFDGFSRAEHLNEVELALRRVLVCRPAALSAEREREIQAVTNEIAGQFRDGLSAGGTPRT